MATEGPGDGGEIQLKPGAEPLAGYRLVRRLGRGGSGEVWEAEAPGGLHVALKFIRMPGDWGAVELRALEVVKSIRHPNLLALFGSSRGDYLIVGSELADRTLGDRLKEARAAGAAGIPRAELLDAMEEAARGIDHLNACRPTPDGRKPAGIQHRDIKPANILLLGGGVKVADFGLARLLEHDQTGHTGHLTPTYAAPEFFRGRTSDRSDQYSLAVTYCELRGGRPPFAGDPAAIAAGHLYEVPDLGMLPPEERPAIARALAKEPAARWPTCRDLVGALRSASGRPEAGPRAAGPARPTEPAADAATAPLYGSRGVGPTDPAPPSDPGRPIGALPEGPAGRPRRGRGALAAVATLTALGLALLPYLLPGPPAAPARTPIQPARPAGAGGRAGTVATGPAPPEREVIALPPRAPAPVPPPSRDLRAEPVETAEAPRVEAKETGANDAEAAFRVGNAAFAAGRYEQAIAAYDEAIRLRPGDAAAYSNRGNAYQKLGAFERAIASYDRAIALLPGVADAYFNRGTALVGADRLDRAIADFSRAIELRPGFADAYHNRGVAFERMGDRDRARSDIEAAARIEADAGP